MYSNQKAEADLLLFIIRLLMSPKDYHTQGCGSGSGVSNFSGSGSGFQISLDPDPVSAQILEQKKLQKGL